MSLDKLCWQQEVLQYETDYINELSQNHESIKQHQFKLSW